MFFYALTSAGPRGRGGMLKREPERRGFQVHFQPLPRYQADVNVSEKRV